MDERPGTGTALTGACSESIVSECLGGGGYGHGRAGPLLLGDDGTVHVHWLGILAIVELDGW